MSDSLIDWDKKMAEKNLALTKRNERIAQLEEKLREAEQALSGRTVSCVCGGKAVGVDVEEGRRGI